MFGPDGRPVAYASLIVEPVDDKGHKVLKIYDVGVHPEHRKKGLARKLIEAAIEDRIAHYGLDRDNLLLALSVDLNTPMAAQAIALYAKMGFLLAWQPCSSVTYLDMRMFFENLADPSVASPMNMILSNTRAFQEVIMGVRQTHLLPLKGGRTETPQRRTHMCMFKFYGDTWLKMGHVIADPIPAAPFY